MQPPCPYDGRHVTFQPADASLEVQAAVKVLKMKPPANPKHPERICWGCDKYCPADDLACGNGTIRTLHPVELFGEDWLEWADERNGDA